MKILSWNINGIRAAYKNGFLNWFIKCKADIFGVQEIRANFDQIPLSIKKISNFYSNFVSSKKKDIVELHFFLKNNQIYLIIY